MKIDMLLNEVGYGTMEYGVERTVSSISSRQSRSFASHRFTQFMDEIALRFSRSDPILKA
jgi:hypothetical protein